MNLPTTKKIPKENNVSVREVLLLYLTQVKKHQLSAYIIIAGVISGGITAIWVPLLYKDFFDILGMEGDKTLLAPKLVETILTILAVNVFGWAGWRIASFANAHFQPMVMADLKQHSYEYLLGHSYTFFANNFTGSLVQKVNRCARAFERLSDRILWNIIPLVIRLAGVLVVLFFVNRTIMYALLFWLFIFILCNYFFARWKLKYDIKGAEADSRTTAVLSDSITNSNNIQLFTGAESEKKNFKEVNFIQARLQRLRWSLDATIEGAQAVLSVGMEFFLFYYAINYWQDGLLTIGAFVLIQVYFFDLVGRLWDFSRIIRDIYESFADGKEMAEILAKPHDVRDMRGAIPISVSKGKIEFQNLIFSFNETRTVLDKVNLDISSGEKVALIGPSGAGKSTFFRLLLRFYEPAGGKILIDGQNIQRVTQESLRKNISLVPQDPLLFHRTLLENIKYGRSEATDEEALEAAKLAHCDEFALGLPKGYDTYVGERGIKLSGGERQRVAIARAILKNAPILLLDEATSSLDSHSEALIQEALEHLMKGKTTIAIAHRLSTIKKMDRIIVLDGGNVTESGTHEELLAKDDSLYKKLWTLQSGGFIQEEEGE